MASDPQAISKPELASEPDDARDAPADDCAVDAVAGPGDAGHGGDHEPGLSGRGAGIHCRRAWLMGLPTCCRAAAMFTSRWFPCRDAPRPYRAGP